MYNDYFSFHRTPFSIAPDPEFLYLSEKHREALAHLVYGLQTDGGFVLLTGEVGTGKTTLLRSLLTQIPSNVDVAFILNPKLTVKELLETLCEELGIPTDPQEILGAKQFIDRLNRQLLKAHAMGRSTVLIIDEAQNLSPAVLEQIRLLTNLETNDKKLLRIILLGQPELAEILHREDLRQLAQRITARYHLSALEAKDTHEYICHRLKKAGGSPNTFSKRATQRIHKIAKGIPRLINIIADRSLLGAYVESSHQVTAKIVNTAAKEVIGPSPHSAGKGATAALVIGILIALWYMQLPSDPPNSMQEPLAALSKEPSAALNKQPSAALSKKPSAALNKKPSAAPNKQPSAAPNKQPAAALDRQPAATRAQLDDLYIQRPIETSRYRLHREALASLFELWNRPLGETLEIPCNYAPNVGLQCLRRAASWEEVLKLDRPFVIELTDEDQAPFYAAVTQQSRGFLNYSMSGNSWKFPDRSAPDNWNGYYILLWRMPPEYRGLVKAGSQSVLVGSLRNALEESLGYKIPAEIEHEFFGSTLKTALLAFQQRNGIEADGIAGALTWLLLNTDSQNDVSKLRTEGR